MDGTRQVWHGGPLTQVQDFIHQAGILYFGTDPVAMDTVELEAIEKKRREEGAPSVWEHKPRASPATAMEFYHNPTKRICSIAGRGILRPLASWALAWPS